MLVRIGNALCSSCGHDAPLLFSLFFVLMLLLTRTPLMARADGGAPNLAYVSGTSAGVSVIDVGQGKVTNTISVTGDPHTILLSLDGRFLYAAQPSTGQVTVFAAKTGQVICTVHLAVAPSLLTLDQDNATLYAAGNGADSISAIDAATCVVRHTFKTASPVYGLALTVPGLNPSGGKSNQLWAAGTTALMIFDDQTGASLGNVPIADGPRYLSIPPGFTLYVTTLRGSVEAVDMRTRTVHQLLTGGLFGPMDYDALTGEVYVPDQKHNLLDILAPIDSGMISVPPEPERVIRTNVPPASVAITNDGLLGFVALQGGDVTMLDLIGRHAVYTVHVGGTPHFIITGLYPPSFVSTAPKKAPTSSQQRSIWMLPPNIIIYIAIIVLLLIVLSIPLWVGHVRRIKHPGQR
jgi:DNA-binding beta-propeller fold protein YncE